MLVLSRRLMESIIIDGTIRVQVVYIGDGRVKLGIEAPAGMAVDREEIHQRKLQERRNTNPNTAGRDATESRAARKRLLAGRMPRPATDH